ncbi:MAG: methionine synthase [Oscillospiraceae bacterium]|nr:methionine synthase [Oscillospiraceae bacterium]
MSGIRMFSPEIPLVIDKSEVFHYLGYGKSVPDPATTALINDCAAQLEQVIVPRCIYAVFPIVFNSKGIHLEGCNLILTGNDIAFHLKNCRLAVLTAATISGQADRLIRRASVADITTGLVMDSCATAVVERLCDDMEEEIKLQYPDSFFTSRYSPGYGDLPLELQRDFLSVLDSPRKIGLCATKDSILTPRKSVTAVIGIGDIQPEGSRTGCNYCRLINNCSFRKRGEYCGLSKPAE